MYGCVVCIATTANGSCAYDTYLSDFDMHMHEHKYPTLSHIHNYTIQTLLA